jgi:hypothetical protein
MLGGFWEGHGFAGCGKSIFPRRSRTSAAKAGSGNEPVIAAVNRCATQNQVQLGHQNHVQLCHQNQVNIDFSRRLFSRAMGVGGAETGQAPSLPISFAWRTVG